MFAMFFFYDVLWDFSAGHMSGQNRDDAAQG